MNARSMTLAILFCAAASLGSIACSGPAVSPETRTGQDTQTKADADAAREAAAAKNEADRLAALWSYSDVPAGKGRQRAASLKSTNDVDTGGGAPKSVLLVFRDHPSWGRSSYLVLQSGDFKCPPGCTVDVTADDGRPKAMAARRPTTHDVIAVFIIDERALWRITTGAKTLTIAFPIAAGGTRTAAFDVAGLDPSRMPGWAPR